MGSQLESRYDSKYLDIILDALKVSASYKPKFGKSGSHGLTLQQFRNLYQSDQFYNWFGLDNPILYAAHKAAGGMTSVYRQIGISCETVFREVFKDIFGLSDEEARWSYEVETPGGKTKKLNLDARLELKHIRDSDASETFHKWIKGAGENIQIAPSIINALMGTVFEIRQGYKSKDSKRQNADIDNGVAAYKSAYLPCIAVMSNQMDDDILRRYRANECVVLTGVVGLNDPFRSIYDFMHEIVGYDLAAFFERNSDRLKQEVGNVLETLLEVEPTA